MKFMQSKYTTKFKTVQEKKPIFAGNIPSFSPEFQVAGTCILCMGMVK